MTEGRSVLVEFSRNDRRTARRNGYRLPDHPVPGVVMQCGKRPGDPPGWVRVTEGQLIGYTVLVQTGRCKLRG